MSCVASRSRSRRFAVCPAPWPLPADARTKGPRSVDTQLAFGGSVAFN